MRNHKTKIIILSGVLVILICIGIALAMAWPFLTAGSSVENEIVKIKASGAPMCRADIDAMKIPDDKNAAVVYDKAFKLLPNHSDHPDLKTLKELIKPKNGTRDAKLWTESEKIIEKYKAVFPLIDAALAKPECQFPIRWDGGFDTILPDMSERRKIGYLTTIISARAMISAKNGSVDKAVRDIESAIDITADLDDQPTIVLFFWRINITKLVADAIYSSLENGSLNEPQMRKLANMLSRFDMMDGYVNALKNERACVITLYDELGKPIGNRIKNGHLPPGSVRVKRARGPYRFLLPSDEIEYLNRMGREISSSELSYHDALQKGLLRDEFIDLPHYAIMTATLLPPFARIRMGRDSGIVEVDGTKIVLGLRAYKQRYGLYPTTLTDLRMKLNWRIHKDMFSGNDFVYKRRGGGFLLYSVGEDLDDDNGKPLIDSDKYPRNGDYVWMLDH